SSGFADSSIWSAKVREHREVLEVAGGKTDPGFFRGSSNSEVSHPNPRMAATPAATKSPGSPRHSLGNGNPDD
ncbi:MAG TPA: hypothetical protein VG448_12655, partial [Solirubrobacterales bacterium]|nr:hypothetical protein [Solirubrobacterales bacterium]